MGKRGQRTGPFHCLESGLWSYSRGEHCRPSELELHVSQCQECQQRLLVIAGEAAKLIEDRPTRKLFRVYQLLAAAKVVPSVAELRVISDKKVRADWRRNAIVRHMMDIVALVDALDEGRQLPGEQGGIFAQKVGMGVDAAARPDHFDGGSCEESTGYAEAVEEGGSGISPEEQVLAAHRGLQAQHGAGGEDPAATQAREDGGNWEADPPDSDSHQAAVAQEGQQGGSPFVSEEALANNLDNAGKEGQPAN